MRLFRTSVLGVAIVMAGCSNPPPSQPTTVDTPPAAAISPYENMLVRRPGMSAEDGKVYVVQNGKKHWVINVSWFTGHGYKFPDDVHQIAAVEFDAIPAGDPIQ